MPRPAVRGRPPLAGRAWWAWAAGAVLAAVGSAGLWRHTGAVAVGAQGDPEQFIWFLAWWAHALAHPSGGVLVTHAGELPQGANLMWSTSMPLAGFLLAPLTWTAGPVVALAALVALGLAANVPAAFALTRRLTASGPVALAAAVGYGVCPFVSGQLLQHPQLLLAWYPPVLFALAVEALTGRSATRRVGLLLGVATAAELLLSEELVVISWIGVALLAACAGAGRVLRRAAVRRAVAVLGYALPVAVVLDAGPLVVQLFGPDRVGAGAFHSPQLYSLDLANVLLPTAAALVHLPRAGLVAGLSGGIQETTGYLLPGLLVLILLGRRLWRQPWARVIAAAAVLAVLLALGPRLHVDARLLPVPGPWRWVGRLPVLSSVLPVRLTVLVDLALVALVSLGLGAAREARPGRLARTSAVLAGAGITLLVLPAWPFPTHPVPVPPAVRSPAVLAAGDVVEFVPAPDFGGERDAPMAWQALTRFRWSLFDAYLASEREVRQLPGTRLRLLCLLGSPNGGLSLPCPADLGSQLVAIGVTVLALGPSPWRAAYLPALTGLLGPPQVAGGLATWRLAPPR